MRLMENRGETWYDAEVLWGKFFRKKRMSECVTRETATRMLNLDGGPSLHVVADGWKTDNMFPARVGGARRATSRERAKNANNQITQRIPFTVTISHIF